MLELKNITLFRGNLCVANQINLTLEKGKIYAILGPNGTGKSSLINAIFGELKFTGNIVFENEILNFYKHYAWKKKIGYMPQDNFVDASLSALEVVLLGLIDHLGIYLSKEQIQMAANIMQELGILHLAHQDISNLSGGQRQMVMFASVLLKNPKILLLDEPVSALDMHHQCILLDHVKTYTKRENLLTLMVLHDLSLAAQFCDEIIILSQGKIQAKGDATIITKRLIEEVYQTEAEIFYDKNGLPCVLAKAAIKN
ncbi:ABC transporter ATP-binding protein [Campylobacter coli]|nr:ABC transporter ATP-binding protein [Campylobacter coli]